MTRRSRLLALLAFLALAACDSEPDVDTVDRPGPIADRPETLIDTVLVEGMPEVMEMRLVSAPALFPVRFSAYVPADMEPVIQRLPGDRASARFVAAFGGVRQPRAFLDVEVYGAGTTLDEARRDAAAYADDRGDAVRRVAVGEHAGRVFRLTIEYPPEYGDGMAPRTAAIVESWRWEDGSSLGTTAP